MIEVKTIEFFKMWVGTTPLEMSLALSDKDMHT